MTRLMSGDQLRDARRTLGEMWGLGRPLHYSELGRALRLQGRDPGSTVRDWETRDAITGPASVAIEYMLDGHPPRDPIHLIVTRRGFD